MKILFLIFLVVPLIEVYLLIQVGGVFGAMATIALVVGTAFLGALLVRSQGFSTIAKVRTQLNQGKLPAVEILEGLFILVAGTLLLTPGFLTDAIGFICLIPPLRSALIRQILANVRVSGGERVMHAQEVRSGRILDGEYKNLDGQ